MADTIRVAVEEASLEVNPGEQTETVITVQNLSVAVGVFSIDVEGLDSSWYFLSSNSVSLFPGDRTTTTLTISPPRESSSLAGEYKFNVKIASQKEDEEEEEVVPFTLRIHPFYEFFADYRPQMYRGSRGSHTLSINNAGNSEMAYALEGVDPEGVCRFDFNPAEPVVPPGETLDVATRVRGKRPFRGIPRMFQYQISVTPPEGTDLPKSVIGQLEAPPRIPSWVFRIASLIIFVSVIVAAVYIFFIYEPPAVVTGMDIAPNRLALTQGETGNLRPIILYDKDTNVTEPTVTWASDRPDVARINQDTGLVQAVGPGTAIITATVSGAEIEPQSATVAVLPTPVSTDCISYTPQNLRYGVSSQGQLMLTDGVSEVLILQPSDDQVNAMRLAKRHTRRCFIGRDPSTVGFPISEVELWIGSSGIEPEEIEPLDCDSYNPSAVSIRQAQNGVWTVTDGVSLLIPLDHEMDAQNTMQLLQRHSRRCFISRQVNEVNQITYYLTHYWE